jgi:D-alanyl-D-alanine carboxypeptidase/D-alanyl-D-alanine-endopeptidase (penicillin-binding protein 4)
LILNNLKRYPDFFSVAAVAWLLTLPAQALDTNRIATAADVVSRLNTQISQPRFDGALWGVKIVSLDSGKTVFENHADRLMSPASNSKLYTAALAFDHLGGDYHIVTPILASAKPDADGTLQGDLIIAGRGDPSWNDRRFGTNFWNLFEPFVAVVTNAGLRHVTGNLVADAGFFRGSPLGSGWTADDLQAAEAGEISALTLDDNVAQVSVVPGSNPGDPCKIEPLQPDTGLVFSNETMTVTNGGVARIDTYRPMDGKTVYVFGQLPAAGVQIVLDVAVPRPAEWFAAALKEALARHGITVDGPARVIIWPQIADYDIRTAVKLGEVSSPPLRELVRAFMKPSQNLEDDLLFEHVGETSRDSNSSPTATSEHLAVIALDQFLAKVGVPAREVHFDEGSGLSRNNLTTANATVALLQYMTTNRWADDFVNALPVAGVDGTLRRRMKNTPAFQNVRAKTGTLRWVNSLSGFVTTAAGERLAFSLMLNRYVPPPDRRPTAELDDIAVMLAQFAGQTDESIVSQYAPFGILLLTQFASAPFPHPARAAGHKYHDEFYSAWAHYSDSTVAMFIPRGFRATDRVDFVVHFHGWRHSVANTLEEYQLVRQFADSGKNAILIVPEGPRFAPDSFDGKLEDTNGFRTFMAEAVEKLRASGAMPQTNFTVGRIILSGHSGGYEAMASILDHGGLSEKIREVWLFDALYAGADAFLTWQKNTGGRLLDIYTDHGGTKQETEGMMQRYQTNGVSFFAGEDTNATSATLQTNPVVFLHSDLVHNDVVARRNTFAQFLQTSCLENK